MSYELYNMQGYILLYENEAKRIQKNILAQSKAVDPEKFEYVGNYRRWANKNNISIRQAGRYFACMREQGLLIKHKGTKYLAKERPSEAIINEDCLPPFLRYSTKTTRKTRCQKKQ